MPRNRQPKGSDLAELIRLARRLGAGRAAIIPAAAISVEDRLADLCRSPRCQNYGLSPSCPPHVSGPDGFRKWLKRYRYAAVLNIEIPSALMDAGEFGQWMGLLHEIAAGVEQAAVRMGYRDARAYAGGSCKRIFCRDHKACRVLTEGGACRHPLKARPSMSGFGINVSKLVRAAGWTMNRVGGRASPSQSETATIAALVLIG